MSLSNELDRVSTAFNQLSNQLGRDNQDDGAHKRHEDRLKELLARVCSAIAADPTYPNLDAAVSKKADDMLNSMIDLAYGEELGFDFLPSFAQGSQGALVSDPEREGLGMMGAGALNSLLPLLASMLGGGRASLDNILQNRPGFQKPATWEELERPHADSSPISRFRKYTAGQVDTSASPLAQALLQARLSARSTSISAPIKLCLPPNSSTLALIGCGGWKERDPILSVFYMEDEEEYGFCKETSISPGLSEVAYQVEMDPKRSFVYVADSDRIKSYRYDVKEGRGKIPAKHTLDSKNDGPLLLLEDGGKIIRGGKHGVESWNVDSLPDHGPNGSKRIGKKISVEDTWRDNDGDEIERSSGTPAHTTTPLDAQALQPTIWTQAPGGQILATHKDRNSCWMVDLEHGLKPITRYHGHGGAVNAFSTSRDDPNSFLTAANDGVARLYDIREPLPRVSFDCGASGEPLDSAIYIHVDGVPLVIAGGAKTECISVWDPRQKRILYELATGNNAVISLAWDAPRSTLWAATNCNYMDRMGNNHDYRYARIPKTELNSSNIWGWEYQSKKTGEDDDMDENEDEDEEDEEDEESEPDEEHGWPSRAYHDEAAFGYAFDSGEHRLFGYKFGTDADPKILPVYGQALPEQDGDYW